MPHSTASEQISQDDQVLPDAPSAIDSDKEGERDESGGESNGDADKEIAKETSKVSLEEIFVTDDEDEEFPSSAATGGTNGTSDVSSSPAPPM